MAEEKQLTDARITALVKEATATDKMIQAKDAGDRSERGLYLRIYPPSKGEARRVWYSAVKDNHGKKKWNKLGEYPALGLSKARDEHRTVRERVRAGDNPTDAKRLRKVQEAARRAQEGEQAARDANQTIRHLLKWYMPQAPKTHKDSVKTVERVFASLLDVPFRELTFHAINQTALDYYLGTSKAQGIKAIGTLRPVLNRAARNLPWVPAELGKMLVSPGPALKRPHGMLVINHMPTLLPVWRDSIGHGQAMWFMAHCALRLDEACELKWKDLSNDLKTWIVPPHLLRKARNGKKSAPPYINFPKQVVDLLSEIRAQEVDDEYVFSTGKKPLPKGKKSRGKLGNWGRYGAKLKAETDLNHEWHRHDIRHFASTAMGDLGIAPHIIEACLGHVLMVGDSTLAGTYNGSTYSPERAEALRKLADALEVAEQEGRQLLKEKSTVGADMVGGSKKSTKHRN